MPKKTFEEYFKEPGTLKNRYIRYIKTNLGKKSAFGKMMNLIKDGHFVNLEQADSVINWDDVPYVLL